ncbi:RHS repeat-associated core domain-containing protein [Pseudomonas helleri]|uniref:RHS repeat-associated core domain-containing protein n=2 Tax=Pseudomonas helleri TaxID=1608996 RepID=A0A6A7YJP9_9PSED|nr:RHS repeat-associated core domain-containing protein [Pseudomonas helleri]MQT49686.1 RHS repeat-associated core domain-containing protein [Pseudomonas helleri]MQT92521.1 RHS repeat-associated core domain-containing protein [Pseudomonas helleri]
MKPCVAALSMVYHYDPLDRLSGVDGRRRFYNRQRIATELEGPAHRCFFESPSQPLAQFKRGDDTPSTLLMTDQHSCVLLSLNTDGLQSYPYSAYGHRPIPMNQQSVLGFNGERVDTITGHYLLGLGYRAFNPVLMRFNSPDSWSPFGKGGTNTYAYCKGDPINHVDPDGHLTLRPLKIHVITLDVVRRRRPRAINAPIALFNQRPVPPAPLTPHPGTPGVNHDPWGRGLPTQPAPVPAPESSVLASRSRSRSASPPVFIPPAPPAPSSRPQSRSSSPPPDFIPPPPPDFVRTSRAPNSAATVSNTTSSIRET